jgi:hypothetical protein
LIPIRIKAVNGLLIVLLQYDDLSIAKIKAIPGKRWDAEEMYWTLPHNERSIEFLLTVFGARELDIDPSLIPASCRVCTLMPEELAQYETSAERAQYAREVEQSFVKTIAKGARAEAAEETALCEAVAGQALVEGGVLRIDVETIAERAHVEGASVRIDMETMAERASSDWAEERSDVEMLAERARREAPPKRAQHEAWRAEETAMPMTHLRQLISWIPATTPFMKSLAPRAYPFHS